jgi:SAM-dependent methyltransferase
VSGHASTALACPLCHSAEIAFHEEAHGRSYHRCARCQLVFLHPNQRLDAEAELAHYRTHENDPDDVGYRRFLSRLADPLLARLAPGSVGLDFGAGPGPGLARILAEAGHRIRIYDPFFAPDPSVLRRTYDFVTASEVLEHLFHPGEELERVHRLLRPGGWLAVMTEPHPVDRPLREWRYARDPTHVAFYSPATLQWIATHFRWTMESVSSTVTLFRKREGEVS